MFPKAHATAYVTSAFRIAWFKVHHPIWYYCAYLSIRRDAFDIASMIRGENAIREKIDEIDENAFVIVGDAREVHGEGFIEK